MVLVSKTLKSQVVSVEGVWHADTVQYAAPFYLYAFYLVNTGNLPIYENQFEIVVATKAVSQINSPPFIAQYFTDSIESGVFLPDDTLTFEPNFPLQGGNALFQQAGDNLIVIWPNFTNPVDVDTSTTPVHVLANVSSVYEDQNKIFNIDEKLYDILGNEYFSIKHVPIGTIYIYNGEKYIKF
ncbi:MAG: hypothetical protein CMD25_00960 [Flavobacteriales bacterium]|nr:hypothetical protein [Flavobacteriales bacterium]